MRRAGGLIFWTALLAIGGAGAGTLAVDHHPVWAWLLGSWIACAAAVSVVLVLTERRPATAQAPVMPPVPARQLENASAV